MNLAKDGIDIGLRTNHIEPMLEFWTNEIGLPYDELLKTGPGARQHRLRLNGSSILKINHHREPQPDTQPSGYRELLIAQDIQRPVRIQDPDGNPVDYPPWEWPGPERMKEIRARQAAEKAAAIEETRANIEGRYKTKV